MERRSGYNHNFKKSGFVPNTTYSNIRDRPHVLDPNFECVGCDRLKDVIRELRVELISNKSALDDLKERFELLEEAFLEADGDPESPITEEQADNALADLSSLKLEQK